MDRMAYGSKLEQNMSFLDAARMSKARISVAQAHGGVSSL